MTIDTTERLETLTQLLGEYANKLLELNREFNDTLSSEARDLLRNPGQLAWLLDRAKRYERPLQDLVNLAAGHLEGVVTMNPLSETELTLRLGEAEVQLHHMLRCVAELNEKITNWSFVDRVARLRESAGLNAMKGGPLRPKS